MPMYVDKTARMRYQNAALSLVREMTLQEKIDLMVGCSDLQTLRENWRKTQNSCYLPYPTNGCERLGIPPLQFADGPRGAVCGKGTSTCFPSSSCRGASFDTALEEKIGAAIGRELRAYGANLFGGVCVNLPYHPGWGRSQEVYGEDSFALGQMGAALVRGVQSEHVMACVKHFAFNSVENSRLTVNVKCHPRTEREVFLPHFKACIDAGAACVMGAFNKYQEEHCCENKYLLSDILRNEWGFDGFVISDWFSALHNTKKAILSGLDVEMPIARYYGKALKKLVESGQIEERFLDEAVLRIVRTTLAFSDTGKRGEKTPDISALGCEDHAQLALKSARESITLLKNDRQVLPFKESHLRKVVILGTLATEENLGDHGSGRVFPAHAVTPLDGISMLLPETEIICSDGDNIAHAKRIAAEADAVIIVAGNKWSDEGEYLSPITSPDFRRNVGGDRERLSLKPHDEQLIQQVGSVNPNTAVVLIGGSTIIPSQWIDSVPAVLMAYYPGQEGGVAIAEILLGIVNPSGKLPFVIPARQSDLPYVDWNASEQFYTYYHGYAHLDKENIHPLFPYGFGRSYTVFQLSDPSFVVDDKGIIARCSVTNAGALAGDEVIQLYVGFANSSRNRPVKTLQGFCRVSLKPGETKAVSIRCPLEQLMYYNIDKKQFVFEHMEYEVYIGNACDAKSLFQGVVTL